MKGDERLEIPISLQPLSAMISQVSWIIFLARNVETLEAGHMNKSEKKDSDITWTSKAGYWNRLKDHYSADKLCWVSVLDILGGHNSEGEGDSISDEIYKDNFSATEASF